ncbi:MAG: glycerophosphodiester phosphodiesterase family protein [Planctomycetia bacterium]|nr:glycerophosphodiester phosphodiesterase family protein [Planctomycetia bacterium]
MSKTRWLSCLVMTLAGVNLLAVEVPRNVAHRGFSAVFPENTLSAVRGAIEAKANGCEMDVYRSKDGVVFLNHDGNLKRYCGVDRKVTELTWEELRKYEVGSFKNARFAGEKMPSLEEALLVLKESDCTPVIEIKQEGLEEDILALLKKHEMVDRSVIIAFSQKVCRRMRELDADIFIAWLCSQGKEESEDAYIKRIEKTLKECGLTAVDLHYNGVTSKLVETLKKQGMTIMCWTINDPATMEKVWKMGVDSITTDFPDRLNEVLK